jgi:hypothetical protein
VAEIPGKLVVRQEAPARRWLWLPLLVVGAAVALYAMFELGRFTAGYDTVRASAQRAALETRINQLEQAQRQLHVQLAQADEARISDVRERAEVARTIGELQAQVEQQQQDLEFYRGMVAQPGQPAAVAVRVQQFHITALPSSQQYALHFSLDRMTRPGEPMTGTLALAIEGTRDGTPYDADLASLTNGTKELPFNFRYYANIEQPVTLPADFKPDRVTIEVRPTSKSMAPYRQTFVWNAEPS